jgi:16S rRNA processing protein RimM
VSRAHGLSGEVAVHVHTDDADRRFAPGTALATDPAERGPLTVAAVRHHSGRLLVRFAEAADRTAAEALRGTLLVADSTTSAPIHDPDEFWDHQLEGLAVHTVTGERLGELTQVLHPPGGDLLAVRRDGGGELLVPFVRAIVPTVDLAGGRIVVDPPEGLLDL